MSERVMRRHVVRELLRGADPISVENPAYPGTPDVNCTLGWIELKWMRRWPSIGEHKPVLIPHYTQQQRVWLWRRTKAGGGAWLLLQVGAEWLLFNGERAWEVGRLPRLQLTNYADHYWNGSITRSKLQRALRGEATHEDQRPNAR